MLHDLNIINYRSYKSVSIYIINNNINIYNYIVIHNITMCISDHNTHNDMVNKIMLIIISLIIILIRMILIRTLLLIILLLIILLIMILFITIFDDLSIDDNWFMRTGSYQTKKHETK